MNYFRTSCSFSKNKTKPLKCLFVLALVSFSSFTESLKAQTIISLKDAIDSALHNNRLIQSYQLKADYLNSLKYTAWNIPLTTMSYETGNVYSNLVDNRFGLQQKICFPYIYFRRQSILNKESKIGALNLEVKEKEITKSISEVYADLCFLGEKIKLLKFADSIYSSLAEITELRFEKGATNILEKATAINKKAEINTQLQLATSDFELLQLKLKLLLNSQENFYPQNEEFKLKISDSILKFKLDDLSEVKLFNEEKQLAHSQLKLDKAFFYPELFFAYYNQSIQGWHNIDGHEVFTDNSHRFHSSAVGIGLPLFFNSQSAKVKASKINLLLAENDLQLEIEKIQTQLMSQLNIYNNTNKLLKDFHDNLQKNSEDLFAATFERLREDEIDIVQFVFMIDQTISVRKNYQEIVRKRNQAVIEINYLTSK
jgi:cobalt-zinc-cadmium resistance protein CzcA